MCAMTNDQLEFEIADAIARGNSEMIGREALLELQIRSRAEGRCGSLQTRNGLPCRRMHKTGYTVCAWHGQNAPQTIAKAERLLAIARMPAIEYLMHTVEQAHMDTCHECGFPRGEVEYRRTVIATAKLILDRTGLGPRATLQLTATKADDTDQLVEQMTEAERAEVLALLARVEEIKAAVRLRAAAEATRPGTPMLGAGLVEEPGGTSAIDAEFRVESDSR